MNTEILRHLAPHGAIRAAINYGNPVLAHANPVTGQPEGISVDLAHELARRLDASLTLIPFDAAGKVFSTLEQNAWDIAFLAIDPVRAKQISFTAPYLVIEGSYIVRNHSTLKTMDDFDRPGVRIAVGKGTAYDLFLSRTLKHAELVRTETSGGAIDLFSQSDLDAAAGIRQPLLSYAATHPGYRVIGGRFTAIEQAMGTPKGRNHGLSQYLDAFVEEMKVSGFVAEAMQRHAQPDATVAPLRSSSSQAV